MSEACGGLVEERVKVDRKRFEQMLSEGSIIGCDADSFFKRVMRSTNTQIMWPPKLKPGTKSKKDPHVRITGSPNSINAAKEIIFEQLDTRRNRVTLKMDVAFTDHSHIIGKGGRSIQRVMDETGCHIHFPDSNRTNTAEKSNQVSIAGSAEGVEQSRCRIREMLPITVQFNLPINTGLHSPPTLDSQSPQLQAIQQSYGITITFRCDGSKCDNNNVYFESSRILTVAVRGARSHLFGLRQGLSVLIEYLTGFRASTINVPLTMTIDVAVQHHSFIVGRANCNIKSIMQSTGAIITLPDLSNLLPTSASINNLSTTTSLTYDNNSLSKTNSTTSLTDALNGSNPNLINNTISTLGNRKTAIVIKGPTFESVYNAWQDLLGYLPLILIFDLKEGQDLDAVQVTKLMEQMRQVSILIKPKQRQNTKSIVVRGPEKDSRLLFQVRKQILKLDDCDIPEFTTTSTALQSAVLGGASPTADTSASNSTSQSTESISMTSNATLNSSCGSTSTTAAAASALLKELTQHQQVASSSSISSIAGASTAAGAALDLAKSTTSHQQTQSDQQQHQLSSELQMKAIRAILEPNLEKTRHPTPYWAGLGFSKSVSEPMIKEKLSIGPLFTSNLIDERRISYSNENAINELYSGLQTLSMDHQSSSTSKVFTDTNNNNILANLNSINNSNNNNIHISNNNHGNNINSKLNTSIIIDSNNNSKLNYNNNNKNSNITGNNMNSNSCTGLSINNNIINANNNNNGNNNYNSSNNNNTNMVTNNSSVSNNQKISSCLRLAVFLGRVGLVQYLGLFTQHEIDLQTLLSLTENDFVELGLPYIHRRKLAIAIADVKSSLQNERTISSLSSTFDAAPGAERSRRMKARGSVQGELSDIWSM